jgi:uncharacterized membrane protein YgcG
LRIKQLRLDQRGRVPLNWDVRSDCLIITIELCVVLAAIMLDVVATARVVSSDVYTGVQKALQIALVWVIPIVGAVFVLVVMASDRMIIGRSGSSDASDISSYAGGYGGSGSDGGHGGHGHGGH